jgi:hypothetical protein
LGLFLALAASPAAAQTQPAASDTIVVKTGDKSDPDARVGSYNQPVWTTRRPFTTTRAYVIPAGTIETEFWVRHRTFKEMDETETLYQEEIEVGLPGRIQLDFYLNQQKKPEKKVDHEGYQLELRYAFADWGVLPLNPTIYLEYHPRKDKPEKAEARLLLSDDMAHGWHYAVNVGYEVELWGEEKEREMLATAAFHTNALSRSVSLGAEVRRDWVDVEENRGHFGTQTLVGPSVQWRPTTAIHFDFTPLFGLEDEGIENQYFAILGIELAD